MPVPDTYCCIVYGDKSGVLIIPLSSIILLPPSFIINLLTFNSAELLICTVPTSLKISLIFHCVLGSWSVIVVLFFVSTLPEFTIAPL